MRTSPLPLLFGKAEAAGVTVSPGGAWLGWLARSPSGVLDLYVARLPLPEKGVGGNRIPGATQLTAAQSRDICFSFRSISCPTSPWDVVSSSDADGTRRAGSPGTTGKSCTCERHRTDRSCTTSSHLISRLNAAQNMYLYSLARTSWVGRVCTHIALAYMRVASSIPHTMSFSTMPLEQ